MNTDFYKRLERFQECSNIADIDELVLALAGEFGVERYLIGYMPNAGATPEEQLEHLIVGYWADEWAQRYFSNSYINQDPTIAHVKRHLVPVDWKHIDRVTDGSNVVMNEARVFRLKSGITIPQVGLDGRRIGASYAGERCELDHPDFRTSMTMLSAAAIAAATEVTNARDLSNETVVLTDRELEVLGLIAQGHGTTEIAHRLQRHEMTIVKQIGTAKRRLGAANRPHAIAEAFRRGLLPVNGKF